MAEIFAPGFSLKAALDAAADVYNGVRILYSHTAFRADVSTVCLLVNAHIFGCFRLV